MNILVDIGHPAHVHFFRNAIGIWKQHGHRVLITARLKTYVKDLLDFYRLDYIEASKNYRGRLFPLLFTFIVHTFNIYRVTRGFRPDVLLSISSPMAAWASALSGIPHITFDDTEHAGLEHALYLPFTKIVYTPTSFTKNLGPKQRRYAGFHELAYLHPNQFTPNPNTLREVGLKPGEPFFVVRLVSWVAYHDRGQRGFSPNGSERLIEFLTRHGRVILSSESERETRVTEAAIPVHPAKMHDLLAYATLYVGEGGTMATEAAILGTPAVFVNTLSGGNWVELEKEFGLMYSFDDEGAAINKIVELIRIPDLKTFWIKKRKRMLENKIDVTKFLTSEIEKQAW